MSPIIDFSEDDLLRGKPVTPDWYRVKVGTFVEKTSSGGDSTNWIFEDSRILFNAENGSKEFTNVPITLRFNSKAKGFLVGFFSSLGADVKAGSRYKLEDASGKEVDVFIKNDTYEGRLVNKQDLFRKPRTESEVAV